MGLPPGVSIRLAAWNTVHSLSNTVVGGSAGSVIGMDFTLSSLENLIEQNLVHSPNELISW
jgi:hypothetical protein